MLNTSRELKQQRTQRLQCKTSAPSVLLVTFFSSLILQSSSVYAEFSVADKSWPKQLPPSEYGVHNHYGNAKDSKFAKAIDSPGEMSAAEKDAIAEMIPESELNRWYAKAGIYSSTFKLSKVK